ncbi:MAG TPA: hypothetical protein VHO70_16925 [Chitinispirillaceae bacterium]|nr:hypothetical protein [Chitinispirillaceae bacterium]
MNKKFLFAALSMLLFCCAISAQDSLKNVNPWKYALNTNLTLTLNNYSDNWDGSEVSSFSWGWKLDGFAEKAVTPWFKNVNTLKLAFGQTALQKKEEITKEKKWDSMKKSSDMVDLEVAGRFTLKSFVDPFISARLITQFGDLRVPGHDHFFNPAEITESFGAIRDIVKNNNVDWTARIGGAIRQTVERNSTIRNSTGVDKVVNDGGIEFLTDFKASTKDNRIAYNTQFKLFEAIFIPDASDSITDLKRHPDISWENTLNVSLLKFVMLNFYIQLLYDKEIDSTVRLRQTAGLALTYSIKSAD